MSQKSCLLPLLQRDFLVRDFTLLVMRDNPFSILAILKRCEATDTLT